jgi:16S rRNA (uracil1498-N3)-methyltransferase
MARRFRTALADLQPGERLLDPDKAHYLLRVLRLRRDDTLVVFDPVRALEAEATILQADASGVRVCLDIPRPSVKHAGVPLTLVQGVAKGDKCDAIVRDATELGASGIVFAQTDRCVVRLDGMKASGRRERWEKIAEEAARQAQRGDRPEVRGPLPWEQALALAPKDASKFCLYEGATEPLGPRLLHALMQGGGVAFAVGPEGGLAEDEVAQSQRLGFEPVSLGSTVLRTETVAAAVLGAARLFEQLAMP